MSHTFLKKKNNSYSNLNGSITDSSTSLIVDDVSSFPNSGSFLCTIWDKVNYPDAGKDPNMEIVLVTGVSGNTFTITRAQENRTAVAHADDNAIELFITAGIFTELETQINNKLDIGTTTADVPDSSNKRYVTDSQLVVIGNTSGNNTGDETSSTIKSKLGITTLSGVNTGDQDLSVIVNTAYFSYYGGF